MPLSHLFLTTALGASLALSAACASAQSADVLSGISAGKVAIISDGDYVAKTYADGMLAPPDAGHRDVLTVLSIADGKVSQSTLPVSNSVTAAPEILELTLDGRTAFVTERLGERPEGATTMKELPPGNRLFAVDLSDSANPKLADTAEIGIHPEGLAVRARTEAASLSSPIRRIRACCRSSSSATASSGRWHGSTFPNSA
ncbi:hypothetical protein SAMN03159496_03393 [Rhizobium sp. NFR07]|uniref:hypothetical protein n=1 Tax=Rhizobium sp. NFR07 TaxID=1566262 RepID=UPI0008EC388A|nr:hypothetical protein [Rhizobium sp. NFR07]SFB39342.1 hypothetical protein SAMN03159496_03393 [Rhizobium sp. NFR07]